MPCTAQSLCCFFSHRTSFLLPARISKPTVWCQAKALKASAKCRCQAKCECDLRNCDAKSEVRKCGGVVCCAFLTGLVCSLLLGARGGLWVFGAGRGGQSTVRFTINVITPNPKNLDSFLKDMFDRAKLKVSLIKILAHLAGFAQPPLRSCSAQRQWARLASLVRQIP